jgi:hypothetical protein
MDEEPITENTLVVSLYPNPTTGLIYLSLDTLPDDYFFIEVYDLLGKKVFEFQGVNMYGNFSINLTDQPNGLYLVKVFTDRGDQYVRRLMIRK